MDELDENKLNDVFPSFRQLKEGYINIFTSKLKAIIILGCLTLLGFLMFYCLPVTNIFFNILHVIGLIILFLSVGPVFVFFLVQPIFRLLLQLIIFLFGLLKMFIMALQYFIYVILENTIIGEKFKD